MRNRRAVVMVLCALFLTMQGQADAATFPRAVVSKAAKYTQPFVTSFEHAAVKTVNLDGLAGASGGAIVQKLAEPKATTLKGLGWGTVYGTDATFIVNLYHELREHY